MGFGENVKIEGNRIGFLVRAGFIDLWLSPLSKQTCPYEPFILKSGTGC
jgi:hypothetical protein